MVTVDNWINYTIGCDSNLESDILCCLVAAYNLGMKNKDKKHIEIGITENCGDFVDFEGTEKGKAIVEQLVRALNDQMANHNLDIAQIAVRKYCDKHNIEYKREE